MIYPNDHRPEHVHVIGAGAEAVFELRCPGGSGGAVRVRWRRSGRDLLIEVEDDGPGIAHTENLFVPFFTTKTGGSGIGPVLARQIIEAHGGSLHLANREGSPGAIATVRVPAEIYPSHCR